MFEFLLFAAVCALMAFLAAGLYTQFSQPKTKLQPIKIKKQPTRNKRHPQDY
ncbi:hypothetical protein [Marinomonas sp.]